MVKIFKENWFKWFKDEQGNILTKPFASDFRKDGLTYYVNYTI